MSFSISGFTYGLVLAFGVAAIGCVAGAGLNLLPFLDLNLLDAGFLTAGIFATLMFLIDPLGRMEESIKKASDSTGVQAKTNAPRMVRGLAAGMFIPPIIHFVGRAAELTLAL